MCAVVLVWPDCLVATHTMQGIAICQRNHKWRWNRKTFTLASCFCSMCAVRTYHRGIHMHTTHLMWGLHLRGLRSGLKILIHKPLAQGSPQEALPEWSCQLASSLKKAAAWLCRSWMQLRTDHFCYVYMHRCTRVKSQLHKATLCASPCHTDKPCHTSFATPPYSLPIENAVPPLHYPTSSQQLLHYDQQRVATVGQPLGEATRVPSVKTAYPHNHVSGQPTHIQNENGPLCWVAQLANRIDNYTVPWWYLLILSCSRSSLSSNCRCKSMISQHAMASVLFLKWSDNTNCILSRKLLGVLSSMWLCWCAWSSKLRISLRIVHATHTYVYTF